VDEWCGGSPGRSDPAVLAQRDCNGRIEPVAKEAVADRLEPKTKKYFDKFYRCPGCGKIYWEGSHVDKLRERFSGML
jgi:uncharacterized protein with PIN domain